MKSRRLSGLIVATCFAIVVAVITAGCVTETKYVTVDGKPVAEKTYSYKVAERLVPPGSENLVEHENQWFTFTREGQNYMMRWNRTRDGWMVPTIIPLTKPCNCGKLEASKEVKDGPGLVE